MAPHTTIRIGGRAETLYEPRSKDDLTELLDRMNGDLGDAFFMGRGSNLLIKDGRVRTPIVRLKGEFGDLKFNNSFVEAGAAVSMPDLAMEAAREGYSGLEWACGVPGTVGGAVMMNAGAFDHNTEERLMSVKVMDRSGTVHLMDRDRIEFDYRYCGLRSDYLVLSARFRMDRSNPNSIVDRTRELMSTRRRQQPVGQNTAGCIFKNGEDYFAAELIEKSGLKGVSEGNVVVSERHSNYIINRHDATFDDVMRLIDRIRNRVFEDHGCELELEVRIVDE